MILLKWRYYHSLVHYYYNFHGNVDPASHHNNNYIPQILYNMIDLLSFT